MRYEILSLSGTPVATSFAMDIPIRCSDELQKMRLEYLPIDLVDGDYKCFFTFFTYNEYGANHDVDCVPGLQFSIENEETESNIEWRPSFWGYVKMQPPKIQVLCKGEET